MKAISLLLIIGISAVSTAQFTLNSVSGSFVDGSSTPYSTGSNVDGYGLLSGSGDNVSSFGMSSRPNGDDYGNYARSVVAFLAQNFNLGDSGDTLDVQIPNGIGGQTTSAFDGQSTAFGITSSNYVSTTPSYNFNGSITSSGNAGAELLMESYSMAFGSPKSVTLSSGAFSATDLDNGAWDLDATVGHVMINKEATPTIALNYTIPDYIVQRQTVSLVGQDWNNPFYDRYYSDMLYFLSGPTGQSIGANRSASNHEFAPGDMTAATLAGNSGTLTLDLSATTTGSYTWAGGDLVWDWMGDANGFPSPTGPYPAVGNWVNYQTLTVEVVPEPATVFAMVAGIGGLIAKRRRKTS